MKSYGFTLIEMVIVFAIIALILAVALPGFSDFNRNQVLKTAAEELKASFREAQSSSLSGKKETCNVSLCPLSNPTCCSDNNAKYCSQDHTLTGHYILFSVGITKYSIGILCGVTGVVHYPVKNISFSNGDLVSVSKIVGSDGENYGENGKEMMVIFKPVNKGIGFYEFDGNPESYQPNLEEDINSLTVELTNGRNSYSVTISSTGDVYENKL